MNAIYKFVLGLIGKRSGVITALPNKKQIEFQANMLAEKFMQNGIDPNALKSPEQVKNVLANIDQANMKVIPGDSAEGKGITEKLLGKKKAPVFDMEGNKITDGAKIMGGKEVPTSIDQESFLQRVNKAVQENRESDAAIKARLDASNKKGIAGIKINLVDDSIAKIKSMKPMDAMKEANLVAGKKGRYANLDDNQVKKIIDDTNDHIFERDIPDEDFATGGRAGYKAGSVDKMRRLILKAMGAGTVGVGAAKSGIFSFGKGAGKEVAKEVAQQTTSSMPPPYFFKLAEKIKKLGSDTTPTNDRTIAKSLKSKDGKSDYILEEDVTSGDTIIKKVNKEGDEMITDVEIMEFKKGEIVQGKDGKAVKTPDEYEEVTEANARIEGDVYNDPYYTDGIQVDDIIKEVDDKVPSIKYATGGRAGYFKGGLTALKTLMNYFAKEKGTTGSKLLSDINPKKIDSGIKNLMSKEELNQLKENRTEYVKHLLNIIKSDKKFLDNNRAIVEETIAQAPIGMEDIAKEISDSIKRNAMKENRLERLSVYDKVNPDDAIMDVEMMIKNMSTGKKDKRALNATGGLAYMLGE